MIASYHNHSRWSDGAATVSAILARAAELGVDEVGISDHLTLRPDGSLPHWSMAPERLAGYAEEVLGASAAGRPRVRLGLEVDWFPGQGDRLRAALAGIPFDFLIGSVHEVDSFITDVASSEWEALAAGDRERVHRGYWEAVRSLAESRLFDVVGHLDLPKKFNQHPRDDVSGLVAAALDAIRAADLVVELNTAGWHVPCRDAYPSLELLLACRERGIPVTLSADAHHPNHLRRDFERGLERLRGAGYSQVARFAGRHCWSDPIELVSAELASRPASAGGGGRS
jgi:histidinol-phosphatase (PHP family)